MFVDWNRSNLEFAGGVGRSALEKPIDAKLVLVVMATWLWQVREIWSDWLTCSHWRVLGFHFYWLLLDYSKTQTSSQYENEYSWDTCYEITFKILVYWCTPCQFMTFGPRKPLCWHTVAPGIGCKVSRIHCGRDKNLTDPLLRIADRVWK